MIPELEVQSQELSGFKKIWRCTDPSAQNVVMTQLNRKRSSWRLVAVLGLAALTMGGTSAAHAATPTPDDGQAVTPEGIRSQFTDEQLFNTPSLTDAPATIGSRSDGSTNLLAAAYTVKCTPEAQAPHISSTDGLGVIYKTRVKCTGTGSYPASVTIRVRGGLFFDAAPYAGDTSNVSWSQVRTSNETRVVPVTGALQTFYTPQVGTRGYTGKGHYQATSTVEILVPTGQTVGSHTSAVYWLNPLGT